MDFERIFFFATAGVAVVSGILTITRRNPVQSVLFLIVNFFCIALLYLGLNAQFLAIIQILVYAGAIMVLFLFVIMLLNLGNEEALAEKWGGRKLVAVALSGAVLVQLIAILFREEPGTAGWMSPGFGTVESLGDSLFRRYLLQFEATSVLLLAALVGVIVIAKKKTN
ncbi:MAG TPA: NADH-quinone oxidoreductase subunit J [Bacteroidota bacterium]|nr:NADH-quinone oxidoreductase subunit J [Bacteroidota bacterium]